MKVLLVGAGSYAAFYAQTLLSFKDADVVFEGIVEPYFSTCSTREEIEAAKIPVYATMEDFYKKHEADLAIIATPPFLHCEQSIYALAHGSYVLCEKPLAPTLAEARAMLDAEKKYKKWIAIGFQWSFSEAIQKLKADVLSGALGKPISLKTAISWPRNVAYYNRGTGWAGRISKDGVMMLDSIASNACAHYLHNMLFLLGDEMNTSAEIETLSARCLRANDIENFDTCSIKMGVKGASLYFIASHATERNRDPEFVYKFQNATVTFSAQKDKTIKAVFANGDVKHYGEVLGDIALKLNACMEAIQEGRTPICTVKTAIPHVRVIERLYGEIPINDFPKERIKTDKTENRIFVEGLYEELYRAYENETLLSDIAP